MRFFLKCLAFLVIVFVWTPRPSLCSPLRGIALLTSLDFEEGDRDLNLVDSIIGTSSIVALGESIHTNGSYHQGIARLARYLIEEKGFRTLLLETPWYWSQVLRNFSHNCRGTQLQLEQHLRTAGETIFRQFASQELKALFVWLRQYNCTHPQDQVHFQGFDIQQASFISSIKGSDDFLLEQYTKQNIPSLIPRLPHLRHCLRNSSTLPQGPSPADLENCLQFLVNLKSVVAADRVNRFKIESSIIALTTEAQRSRLYNAAVSGDLGADDAATERFKKEHNRIRDEGMFEMIKHIKSNVAGKMVLIAHNAHVMRSGEKLLNGYSNKAMGSYLAEAYATDYKVIACLSAAPTKASWLNGENLYQPGNGSVELVLNSAIAKPALVDTSSNSLISDQPIEFNGTKNLSLKTAVDGILFFPTTQSMTPWN